MYVVVVFSSHDLTSVVKVIGPVKFEESAKALAKGYVKASAHRLTEV